MLYLQIWWLNKWEPQQIINAVLSDFEYEGEVQGTNKTPYRFFAVSPEDLKDYEDWSENDYIIIV